MPSSVRDLAAATQLQRADALPRAPGASRFSRAAIRGQLAELSAGDASAVLTAALGLVRDAQQEGETAAWVTDPGSFFFPPDAAEGGVDLDTLAVVRAPVEAALGAADKLARSGGFGLIVIDLPHPLTPSPASGEGGREYGRPRRGKGSRKPGGGPSPGEGRSVSQGALSRLLGLARKHDTAIVFLTRKTSAAPSLGSLVSLRGETRRTRVSPDRHEVTVRALKDKRRAPGWRHAEICRGPAGLR